MQRALPRRLWLARSEVAGVLRAAAEQRGKLSLKLQATAAVEALGRTFSSPLEFMKEVALSASAPLSGATLPPIAELGRERLRS